MSFTHSNHEPWFDVGLFMIQFICLEEIDSFFVEGSDGNGNGNDQCFKRKNLVNIVVDLRQVEYRLYVNLKTINGVSQFGGVTNACGILSQHIL